MSLSDWRIIAEGTFFYQENAGFGHLGGSKGFFLVDRIYQREPINEKEPEM
jgi:hypothetical protein